jgi:hypothetical protein
MRKVRHTSSRRRKHAKLDAKAGKQFTPEVRLTDSLPRQRAKPDARSVSVSIEGALKL